MIKLYGILSAVILLSCGDSGSDQTSAQQQITDDHSVAADTSAGASDTSASTTPQLDLYGDHPAGFIRYDTLNYPEYGITLYTETTRLDTTRHELTYRTETFEGDSYTYLWHIDGKPIFGTDQSVPVTQLTALRLLVQGERYELDVSTMYNPWGGSMQASQRQLDIHCDNNCREVKVAGFFSDGAGGYDAEWRIRNGRARRVKIEKGEC